MPARDQFQNERWGLTTKKRNTRSGQVSSWWQTSLGDCLKEKYKIHQKSWEREKSESQRKEKTRHRLITSQDCQTEFHRKCSDIKNTERENMMPGLCIIFWKLNNIPTKPLKWRLPCHVPWKTYLIGMSQLKSSLPPLTSEMWKSSSL